MSRDWQEAPAFTEQRLRRAIERIQRPTFYGELHLKSVAGKITDAKFIRTEKPGSPED